MKNQTAIAADLTEEQTANIKAAASNRVAAVVNSIVDATIYKCLEGANARYSAGDRTGTFGVLRTAEILNGMRC